MVPRANRHPTWEWCLAIYFQDGVCCFTIIFQLKSNVCEGHTLQGINISHLGKRKIIFKMPFLGDMLVPWRVTHVKQKTHLESTYTQIGILISKLLHKHLFPSTSFSNAKVPKQVCRGGERCRLAICPCQPPWNDEWMTSTVLKHEVLV